MLEMKSNFHPASEPKNGYIGKADITIANAYRLNNVSVFSVDGGYSISFSEYGDKNNSYVVPKSKEAYAAMLGVVEQAIHSENHFGFAKGEYGPKLTVRGTKVSEPYADGRYSVEIGDLCTLHGITTQWVEFNNDGKQRGFVSVNMPTVKDSDGKVSLYENKDGKKVANLEFEGIVSKWTDKAGKDQSLDYGVKLADAVKKVRKELYPEKYTNRKASLNEQVSDANDKKASAVKEADAMNTHNKKREESVL